MRRSGIGSEKEVSVNEILTRVLARGVYEDGIGMNGIQRLIDDTKRMIGVETARDRVIFREIDGIGIIRIVIGGMQTPADDKHPNVAVTMISVLATERYLNPCD